MNNAPNLRRQPLDKSVEILIFAGADAWAYAKDWQENNPIDDTIPPIVLADAQLLQLSMLRIVDYGRQSVRVCRAGHISQLHLSIIATMLAMSDVQRARLFSEIHEQLEDWSPRLKELKSDASRGASLVVSAAEALKHQRPDLSRMAPNERGKLLAECYSLLAVCPRTHDAYQYEAGIWTLVANNELKRKMVELYEADGANYNTKAINEAVDVMKLSIPLVPEAKPNLISFTNGVYDLTLNCFAEHQPDNGLRHNNGIQFGTPSQFENLHDHAPNFHKWLMHASGNDIHLAKNFFAALHMVLTRRHDFQLFIELSGVGGSGKSIMMAMASMLAGSHNTASGSMKSLDDPRARAQFADKSLIMLPDQSRYTGDGAGIKAITGGDPVEIDPKYIQPYTAVIPAVVVASNNEPMVFNEHNGGIARRRVIFHFSHPISDDERDLSLIEKIKVELPVIIRRLLATFQDPEQCRTLLEMQRSSKDALAIKRHTDPVTDFCGLLTFTEWPTEMMMGGSERLMRQPRKYVYHAYLAYMDYNGLKHPLSLRRFTIALKQAATEYGAKYSKRIINGRTQTNIKLPDAAISMFEST